MNTYTIRFHVMTVAEIRTQSSITVQSRTVSAINESAAVKMVKDAALFNKPGYMFGVVDVQEVKPVAPVKPIRPVNVR